ncbi:hypothetical protein K437DRAFT_292233 [Tilletiaria anomala UBC 951]|uniref:Uncharacterized protein n=1 Tax=Tilletiaria anomala (strain ATCC 24038 / CBS 436.72 / UBC 951) TaxID=1037660 RepID=A0A066WRG1_TILAU|nr:uncharacterized protein K437DRAFT_292233 [Tilletiaria anomala UBC 951]KDN53594.1 hypothetical protein K437DRAFT_292233 [Tilletiaria anomala UBC 951]
MFCTLLGAGLIWIIVLPLHLVKVSAAMLSNEETDVRLGGRLRHGTEIESFTEIHMRTSSCRFLPFLASRSCRMPPRVNFKQALEVLGAWYRLVVGEWDPQGASNARIGARDKDFQMTYWPRIYARVSSHMEVECNQNRNSRCAGGFAQHGRNSPQLFSDLCEMCPPLFRVAGVATFNQRAQIHYNTTIQQILTAMTRIVQTPVPGQPGLYLASGPWALWERLVTRDATLSSHKGLISAAAAEDLSN